MSLSPEVHKLKLPSAEKNAYFPSKGPNEVLANEAIKRAGKNLAYAIEYGSHVSGDASPTSIHDMILVVKDVKEFHRQNMRIASSDYGLPRSLALHTFLNRYGFNFYHTTLELDGQTLPVKYAVISQEDFVKGCNGTLAEKERRGTGDFGFYVAGRMQKAALRPLFKGDEEQVTQIEQGINTARIDGMWLALGLLEKTFSFDELLTSYVSLSYLADLRVEKPGKIQTLIENSRQEYEEMLSPILNGFIKLDLVTTTEDGKLEKVKSLSREKVDARLKRLRLRAAYTNFGKNTITVGVGKGLNYALAKVKRARSGT